MSDLMALKLRATVQRLVPMLQQLAKLGDLPRAAAMYRSVAGGPLSPHRLVDSLNSADDALLRAYVEAWNEVAIAVWLNPLHPRWRELLVPKDGRFRLIELSMNPFWLGWFDSDRLGREVVPLPPSADDVGIDAHANALGRILLQHDARARLDYEALFEATHPELRAAVVFWFLSVYLVSPRVSADARIEAHRDTAIRSFSDVHGREVDCRLPPLLKVATAAAFRSGYLADDPSELIGRVVDQLVLDCEPTVIPPVRESDRPYVPGRFGAVLSTWSPHKTVFRCISPLLERVRTEDFRGFWFAGGPNEAAGGLAPEWKGPKIKLTAQRADDVSGLRAAADAIRSAELDVLYFTEVGLTVPSRWLGAQRLARVQATGYGHPVTTGSPAMDYYIGGAAVEGPGARYRERLVLIPGLGVDTAPPPEASPGLVRPDDGVLRLVSLASFDKLNSRMLAAWRAILDSVDGPCELHVFPSAPKNLRRRVGEVLRRALPADRLRIHHDVPRQVCVDTLARADVYLDSYPFGGYNTVIEALSVGLPVVTHIGRWAYQRVAAAMLRQMELPEELIATAWEEYVTTGSMLCRDASYRAAIRDQLDRDRVVATLCGTDASAHFEAALHWMSENGPTRGAPVLVAAGEAPRVMDW